MDAALVIPWGMFALPAVEVSLLWIFLGLRSLTDGSQRRSGIALGEFPSYLSFEYV